MKKNKFKLNIDIPPSSQSDIAFLLIIFFIITAIFFKRNAITFKLWEGGGKNITAYSNNLIKIKLFNNKILINNKRVLVKEVFPYVDSLIKLKRNNIAIIYFSNDLKYEKFINLFEELKKIDNIKIFIREMKPKE